MRAHLTAEEYDEVTDILTAAEEHSDQLSPREVLFVDDMNARIALWDRRMRLTEPQLEWLRSIQRKIG